MQRKRILGVGIVVVLGLLAGWVVTALASPDGDPDPEPAIVVSQPGSAPTAGPSGSATPAGTRTPDTPSPTADAASATPTPT